MWFELSTCAFESPTYQPNGSQLQAVLQPPRTFFLYRAARTERPRERKLLPRMPQRASIGKVSPDLAGEFAHFVDYDLLGSWVEDTSCAGIQTACFVASLG